MGKTYQNETWGIVTEDEHAAMRLNARTCTRCGMLATVDPIAHEARYDHAPEFWFGQQLHRWDGSQMRFVVIHDNRKRYLVTFLCGKRAEVRATSAEDAREQAQTGPSVHIVSVIEAPFRIGHHAEALTEAGRLLVYRPSMAGEVLADFPSATYDAELRTTRKPDPWPEDGGLSQAREWARRTLADHPLAVAVSIRESHQPYEGAMWKQGPHVETVRRDETATPEPEAGVTEHDHHVVREIRPVPPRDGHLPSWLVAAQCAAGTWATWLVVRERGRLLFTLPRYFQRAEDDQRGAALAHLDDLAARLAGPPVAL
jgi:hypothetical protein